ncbi:proline racemase family protein [Stygiobacter electus]|uniref:Proline racemase family protein n=1 Tax=Stygiobacter electus TaxID=3032292 RepID=A0AAE3TE69_9BACT|nr:proline racemase family protein [Stygiobacter electus]MDF1611958.1 proline racemase family protein [Stygiobacter electus]
MTFTKHFRKISEWNHPDDWIEIETIDAHTAGEPLRIILSGFPEIKGNSILEKRKFLKDNFDYLRTSLMFEPRGHADMYGCIITPPVSNNSDFGVIFMHNEGYSTMCGHGIIAVTKVVLETGMFDKVEPTTKIKIDSPAGLITSYAKVSNKKIDSVYFENVPSFVLLENKLVDVPQIGKVNFDVAFGGAFYAFVDADNINLALQTDNYKDIISKGMLIKNAVMKNFEIKHPFDDELSFLYGTIFYSKPKSDKNHSRHVCVFANGEVDRSPTGTGISARAAILYLKNQIKLNEQISIESIIDTTFSVKVISETKFGNHSAVIPQVEGNAFITGKNTFYIAPNDPLKNGFFLR